MRIKTEKALDDAIKGGGGGAFLFCGNEAYLISSGMSKLLKSWLGEDPEPFAVERLDGSYLDYDHLYTAVTAIPMLMGRKAVVTEGLAADKITKSDVEKMAQVLEDRADTTLFLVNAGESGKSAKAKGLVAAFDKAGTVVELSPRTGKDVERFLVEEAKKRGCALPPALAGYILESCGNDMCLLEGEIAKVCAYAGSGQITREQVDLLLCPKVEARVFDLSKRILSKDYQGAMSILDTLFYLKESAVSIVSVLAMTYVDLYRAKAARAGGKSVPDMVKDFDYKGKDFRPRNAMSQCGRLSEQALRKSLEELARCDRNLKSSRGDDRIMLEQTVTRLFTYI